MTVPVKAPAEGAEGENPPEEEKMSVPFVFAFDKARSRT